MSKYHQASARLAAAVTACRHGSFLTEETCSICRAEAEELAEHAPYADAPEHAGMDATDLEAEQVWRATPPRGIMHERPHKHKPSDRRRRWTR